MTNIFNNINKNMSVSNKKDNTVVKKVNDVENKISDKEKPIKFIQAPEVKMTFANLNDGTKYRYTSRYIKGFETIYGKFSNIDMKIKIGEGIDGIAQNYYTNGNVKFAGSDGPKNSWASISVDERDYFIEKGWLEIMEDFYKKQDKVIVKITVSSLSKETPNGFANRIITALDKINTTFGSNSDKKYFAGLATPYTYSTKKLDIYCCVPAGQLRYMVDFAYKLNANELYLLQKMDGHKKFVEPARIADLVEKIMAK